MKTVAKFEVTVTAPDEMAQLNWSPTIKDRLETALKQFTMKGGLRAEIVDTTEKGEHVK